MSAATAHPKRPQLTLDELQHVRALLGAALTLLAISTVIYMEVDAWSLMAVTTVVTMATALRPTLPARVPPLVHTLAFPTIVAFFAADLWLKTEVLPAMVRLDILLLLYRSLSYRQRRDDLQIIVLGLFLVVVAGVLTVSIMFAAHILVYTGCALALLLVLTLCDAAGKPAVDHAAEVPGSVPLWAQHADWPQLFRRLRAATDWRVVGLGAVLFAGVLAVSGFLFLAIPRFQLENAMFLDRLISKKSKSGFSDRVRFGDVTEIQQDHSVALSVDVSDHSQIPASPYWRMIVLDRYENQTFRMSQTVLSRSFEIERHAPEIVGYGSVRRGVTFWTFYMESGVSRYLPLLGRFERLRFRERQNFRFSPSLTVVQLRQEPVSMLAYQVEDFELSGVLPDPDFAARLAAARARPDAGSEALATGVLQSEDHTVLARIAQEISAGEEMGAPEFSRRASEWLRRQHDYTLAPRIPAGAGDPLVRWLDSRQAGHCELFAGSLVLLARTAGFPARVVTGFKGGTWNAYSNNFTIRNSDAHAWAEVFDERAKAWLRVDPLDAASGQHTGADVRGEAAVVARTDRSWGARLESLRVFWYRRIVSFDHRSQAETLKAVKEATQKSGRQMRDLLAQWTGAAKAWLVSPWDVRRISSLLALVLGIAAAVWVWREFGRAWWNSIRGRGGRRGEDPVRREAGRWLARLAASKQRIPEAGAVLPELQRLRFGPRVSWGEPQKVFRRARHAWREARRWRAQSRT